MFFEQDHLAMSKIVFDRQKDTSFFFVEMLKTCYSFKKVVVHIPNYTISICFKNCLNKFGRYL